MLVRAFDVMSLCSVLENHGTTVASDACQNQPDIRSSLQHLIRQPKQKRANLPELEYFYQAGDKILQDLVQKTGEAFDVAAQMTAKLADQIPFEVIPFSIVPLSMYGCSCLSF